MRSDLHSQIFSARRDTCLCHVYHSMHAMNMPENEHLCCVWGTFKGIVHPKIKFHLSTHHYAHGGGGGLFESNQHFWSSRGKMCFLPLTSGQLDDTTSRSSMEAFNVFCLLFFFYVWRSGHHFLKWYWIWLKHCLPLKLQNLFVDSNPSPPPPSAEWCVDNEWILNIFCELSLLRD